VQTRAQGRRDENSQSIAKTSALPETGFPASEKGISEHQRRTGKCQKKPVPEIGVAFATARIQTGDCSIFQQGWNEKTQMHRDNHTDSLDNQSLVPAK